MTKLDALYSPKQQQILKRTRESDWFLMINHGAVRAGKTVIDNDVFLMELLRAKENAKADGNDPMYILGATSAGTLYTNVLKELSSKYDIEFKFDKYNNFTLFDVYVVTTYTGNIGGLRSIRGMTAYGAYINEMSLANKEVFDEITKRCSGTGARILGDTNPDHPNHWLKTDYIDNADGKTIVEHNFTIFDNPFLSERYRENLIKSTPTGVFTDRGIYGLWTSGEGAIYRDFNLKENVITRENLDDIPMKRYFAGVDFGFEHYGSMVVMAEDMHSNFYLVEEHAHRHKFIDEWVETAQGIKERYGNIKFYSETARPEYIEELKRNKIRAVKADKKVLAGIEEVAKLFKRNKLFILYDETTRFKEEIFKYSWNERTGEPIKEFDDVLDSIRYAIYTYLKGSSLTILK